MTQQCRWRGTGLAESGSAAAGRLSLMRSIRGTPGRVGGGGVGLSMADIVSARTVTVAPYRHGY